MSEIKKSERKESKLQTIHNAYMIRMAVTNLAENNFYITFSKIEEKIKKNKVEDSFFLLGKRENPYPYIKKADYFCLLSQFEGYPMVLLEAKLLNKKILITDTAAREAVQNYENIAPVIGCHVGPGAYGFVYIEKE